MNATICKAISDHAQLVFSYKGVQRWVEPHAYGLQSNGKEALCAWQIAGGSGDGFRLFLVDDMIGLSIADLFEEPREGYRRGDQRFQPIFAEL